MPFSLSLLLSFSHRLCHCPAICKAVTFSLQAYLHLCRECPDELKEAISSLIYSSSRCGDFPELIEIRSVFQSHFGKEFVACSIELRNNCGVNTKVYATPRLVY